MSLSEQLLPKAELYPCGLVINDQVMKFNPTQPIEGNALHGIGLNSHFLNMRQELHHVRRLSMQERRARMERLSIEDFLQEKRELGEVGLGYINTQP